MVKHEIGKGSAQRLAVHIAKYCDVDEGTGELRCKKCGERVVVDWFEKTIECLGCDEVDLEV